MNPQSPAPRSEGEAETGAGLHRCGTYGAYQRHRRAGETPCTECRRALREYVAAWRQKTGNPRGKTYNAAYSRAVSRLVAAHKSLFDALLDEELGL